MSQTQHEARPREGKQTKNTLEVRPREGKQTKNRTQGEVSLEFAYCLLNEDGLDPKVKQIAADLSKHKHHIILLDCGLVDKEFQYELIFALRGSAVADGKNPSYYTVAYGSFIIAYRKPSIITRIAS